MKYELGLILELTVHKQHKQGNDIIVRMISFICTVCSVNDAYKHAPQLNKNCYIILGRKGRVHLADYHTQIQSHMVMNSLSEDKESPT